MVEVGLSVVVGEARIGGEVEAGDGVEVILKLDGCMSVGESTESVEEGFGLTAQTIGGEVGEHPDAEDRVGVGEAGDLACEGDAGDVLGLPIEVTEEGEDGGVDGGLGLEYKGDVGLGDVEGAVGGVGEPEEASGTGVAVAESGAAIG